MDETIINVRAYLKIINKDIENMDKKLVNFIIEETLERIQLYLNTENIPERLERIIANIVNTGIKRCEEIQSGTDKAIASISDNGQSIAFSNEVTKYFASVSDEELFCGCATLLSRYRRVKVVYPKSNEE